MIHLVLAVVFHHSSTPHLSVLVHSSLFFTVFLTQFFIYQSDITVTCFVLVVYLNSASPKSISSSTVLYFSFVLCFLLLFFPSFFLHTTINHHLHPSSHPSIFFLLGLGHSLQAAKVRNSLSPPSIHPFSHRLYHLLLSFHPPAIHQTKHFNRHLHQTVGLLSISHLLQKMSMSIPRLISESGFGYESIYFPKSVEYLLM